MKYVTPETLAWWKPALSGNPSLSQMLGWWDRKLVQAFRAAGVILLVGTDTPNPPMIPGFSLHDELRTLVEAGLTPYEALEASTRNAAEFLGGDFGTVAVGKRADLILLRQNPLDNIANLSTRDGVMLRGQWFPQAELQRKVDAIASGFQKNK
jgi:imidazolonepropionase-like amidohydrolase